MSRDNKGRMTGYRWSLIILVIFFYQSQIVQAQTGCPDHWFGSRCQFYCHCPGQRNCDNKGNCPTGGCRYTKFGPACQYIDVTHGVSSTQSITLSTNPFSTSVSWPTDNDDNTCNAGSYFSSTHQKITIPVKPPQRFTWLRLVVNKDYDRDSFNVEFNSNIQCTGKRQAAVDSMTVDIHCQVSSLISQVNITGDGVRSLCSVHVSGGRNVALKQNTSQTSTADNVWIASRAVDGSYGTIGGNKTCSCTRLRDDPNPTWSLFFSHPVTMYKYILWNRPDCCQTRLNKFIFKAFTKEGSQVYDYADTRSEERDYITVIPSSVVGDDVAIINITAGRNYNPSRKEHETVLALCEVQIFGEISCEPGRFGRECESTCNCDKQGEACFVATGGCPSGCAAGYQGEDCLQVCTQGRYGQNCTEMCSDNCVGGSTQCDHVDGKCHNSCKAGYQGDQCKTNCTDGTYGEGCGSKCSTECTGQRCNNIDGRCHTCVPGRRGDFCDEPCSNTTWGQGCLQMCSTNCSQQLCQPHNGSCFKCETGMTGRLCDLAIQQEEGGEGGGGGAVIGAVIGAVLAIIIVLAMVIFFCRVHPHIDSTGLEDKTSQHKISN